MNKFHPTRNDIRKKPVTFGVRFDDAMADYIRCSAEEFDVTPSEIVRQMVRFAWENREEQ